MTDERAADDAKVAALRDLIPATGAGIYLDTAYRGPLPAETAAAMRDADDWELRVGRAAEGRDEDFQQRVEEAQAVVAALIGADPDEMVLTSGVEVALDLARRLAPANQLEVVHLIDPNTGATRSQRATPRTDELWVAVDASLAAGAVAVDVVGLDAAFVVFSGDRWLLGPEETAALWISPRARSSDVLVPMSVGLSRTAVLGLARSVGWIEMYVGLDWAYVRTHDLARGLHDRLSAIEGVTVATPPDLLGGVVAFGVAGWGVEVALDELRRRVFGILGHSDDGRLLRASVSWFNTEEELDRFAAAVAEIASNTPETLPRRPPLIVR